MESPQKSHLGSVFPHPSLHVSHSDADTRQRFERVLSELGIIARDTTAGQWRQDTQSQQQQDAAIHNSYQSLTPSLFEQSRPISDHAHQCVPVSYVSSDTSNMSVTQSPHSCLPWQLQPTYRYTDHTMYHPSTSQSSANYSLHTCHTTFPPHLPLPMRLDAATFCPSRTNPSPSPSDGVTFQRPMSMIHQQPPSVNAFHPYVLNTQKCPGLRIQHSPSLTLPSEATPIKRRQDSSCVSRNPVEGNPLRLQYGAFSDHDDTDINLAFDGGQGLDDDEYDRLKKALHHELENVRNAKNAASFILEREFQSQSGARSISQNEREERRNRLNDSFHAAGREIIKKFRFYIHTYRNLDFSARARRGAFSPEQNCILRTWLFRNFDNPYPEEQVKRQLAAHTCLTLSQIDNWLINARSRIVTPCRKILTGDEIKRNGFSAYRSNRTVGH